MCDPMRSSQGKAAPTRGRAHASWKTQRGSAGVARTARSCPRSVTFPHTGDSPGGPKREPKTSPAPLSPPLSVRHRGEKCCENKRGFGGGGGVLCEERSRVWDSTPGEHPQQSPRVWEPGYFPSWSPQPYRPEPAAPHKGNCAREKDSGRGEISPPLPPAARGPLPIPVRGAPPSRFWGIFFQPGTPRADPQHRAPISQGSGQPRGFPKPHAELSCYPHFSSDFGAKKSLQKPCGVPQKAEVPT